MNRNLIAGKWIDGDSAIIDINPSNVADRIGDFAIASRQQVESAIEAAQAASAAWRDIGIQKRAEMLDLTGTRILARKTELGQLLSREEGKTLPEGIGEVERAGQIFKFFAGEAVRIAGASLESVRPGVRVEILREPVGVVGIITPWNFPIAIPAWKIAPALAFGNCVVFKPAELVPATAHALAEIIHEAGIPPGVFNLLMGAGSAVGAAIVQSNGVDAISFTGSVETGRTVLQRTAERRTRVQLEMGGKNPLIVLDDADLDTAVACAVNGAFFSTGQRCTASSRLIVANDIHDRFVSALVKATEALVVGDALTTGTQMGPVVDRTQLDKDLSYIEVGIGEGATIATGGRPLERNPEGFYLAPTLFTDTTNDMRINREEIFGPIASVIRVSDYAEALAIANDTSFGLSAGICTTSLKYAEDFKQRSTAGMVMVNLPTAGVDYHVPFGGCGSSSFGPREQGGAAVEFYTKTKTAYIKP